MQVEFFVDDILIGEADTTEPYSVSWDSINASEGLHTLRAVATDNLGGVGTDSITVTVNNIDNEPTVTLTNPGDGDSVNGTVIVTVLYVLLTCM